MSGYSANLPEQYIILSTYVSQSLMLHGFPFKNFPFKKLHKYLCFGAQFAVHFLQ